ncbi:MAG: LPS export ABC transporter permease LptF [Pseudomonadota bacterium]
MARFDRYTLSQLLWLFGFFSLVLVAIFWINRAVVLFDRLIGDGQTALVFLEFTALGMPTLITRVLPIATFAAAVYVTNRATSESELTVMQATGSGPWRMARPVAVFGVLVALMMSLLMHILVPLATAQLSQREAEISQNVTARLLTEGAFLSPGKGVTFYTREIGEDGVLRDVFLSDRRDPASRVIYTAAEAYIVRGDARAQGGTTLIMVDGLAQRLDTGTQRLSTAKFADFSFDITALITGPDAPGTSVRHLPTPALLRDWADVADQTGESIGSITERFHARIAQPLFCIVAALIGFATLLIGGFSRFGIWREVLIAFLLLIALDGMRGSLSKLVIADPALWPAMYLPSALGGVLTVLLLGWAARPGLLRRLVRRQGTAA